MSFSISLTDDSCLVMMFSNRQHCWMAYLSPVVMNFIVFDEQSSDNQKHVNNLNLNLKKHSVNQAFTDPTNFDDCEFQIESRLILYMSIAEWTIN